MIDRKTYDFDKMGNQLHVGSLKGDRSADHAGVWHTDSSGDYWCGSWHTRTAEELYAEAQTVLADLLKHHPDLAG